MTKSIHVKVGSLEDALVHFKKAWEDLELGKAPKKPVETLHFENTLLLLKTITAKRLELVQKVHELEKTSVRALAQALERDYKNVHADVKLLLKVGLLIQEDDKITAPWDSICTEIPMVDKAA